MNNDRGRLALFAAFLVSWPIPFILSDKVPQLIQQFASRNYPCTMGWITRTEVVSEASQIGKGGRVRYVYSRSVQYRYEVGGQWYVGDQFRYVKSLRSDADLQWAKSWVAGHPIGSQVQVFYNPIHPAVAALSSGIGGPDVKSMLGVTLFVGGPLCFWMVSFSWLRWLIFRPIAGGVRIWRKGKHIHARLPLFKPFWVAAMTTLALVFIACFLLGTHPSLSEAMAVVCTVFGIGAIVYCWGWLEIRSEKYELIIDEVARTVSLPRILGRKERVTIAFSDVDSITFEMCNLGLRGHSYPPTIRTRSHALKIANLYDPKRAESFVSWPRGQIGLCETSLNSTRQS